MNARIAALLGVAAILFSPGCTPSASPSGPSPSSRAPASAPAASRLPVAAPATAPPVAARVQVHEGAVNAVAVSRDGTLLASGGADGRAVLMRLRDRQKVLEVRHGAPISGVAFDPQGQTLVTVGGGLVCRWSVSDGTQRSKLDIASGPTILAGDGSTVAVLDDAKVGVWDTTSGRLLHNRPLRSRRMRRKVVTGAFSADGTSLILAGSERTEEGSAEYAQTWSIPLSVGGREDAPLFGNDGTRMDGIAVTPDNKTWVMVTEGASPVWHVFAHVDGAAQATELETPARGALRHLVLGPAGTRLVLIDDGARLFDVPDLPAPTDDPSAMPSVHPALRTDARFDFGSGVQAAAFTPDRTSLVTGGANGEVLLWSIGLPH